MKTAAVDWDGTLVDPLTQEWLPGALEAIRALHRRGYRIIVHTTRANRDWGRDQIQQRLATNHLEERVRVWVGEGKPDADVYVDNKGLRFTGDWPATLAALREL